MTDEVTIKTEDGTELIEVPYMSQDYDDAMTSLQAAIAEREVRFAPLIEFMDGPEVAAVVDFLEAHADKFQNEPLVTAHYNAALGCLVRLREASKS